MTAPFWLLALVLVLLIVAAVCVYAAITSEAVQAASDLTEDGQ